MKSPFLILLLVCGVVCNLYSDPKQGTCDGEGGEEDCGCGQLKRDTNIPLSGGKNSRKCLCLDFHYY